MEICRLCFDSNCATFALLNLDHDSLHREQLRIVFPEIDLEAVSVPYICSKCSAALESAYLSKSIWTVCEEKLKKYMERNPDMSSYFLSDVVNDSELPNCEIQVKDEYSEIEVKLEVETYPSPPDPLHFPMEFEEILVKHETEEVDQTEESTSDSEEFNHTPPELRSEAKAAALMTLPERSRERYEQKYELFHKWKNAKNLKNITEKVVLAYFSERAKSINSASLWSEFSMLKSTFKAKTDIDLGKYSKVLGFLKQNSKSYVPKKSKVLTREDCIKFLQDAPDETFLMIKVSLIMGLYGACHGFELISMTLEDINEHNNMLIVTVPEKSKNSLVRTFAITDTMISGLRPIGVIKKYIALRPKHTTHNRLFINYKDGKCTTQVVGKNTICKIPSKIAEFLKLDNPHLYTGHCFKRTSATLLANSRIDLLALTH